MSKKCNVTSKPNYLEMSNKHKGTNNVISEVKH